MSVVGIRLQDRALISICGVNPVDMQIYLLGRSVARFYRIQINTRCRCRQIFFSGHLSKLAKLRLNSLLI